MHIEVRTDRNIDGDVELSRQVVEQVARLLSRFEGQITTVEVHLSDQNAGKGGSSDRRCAIEARPSGQAPLAVTHDAATVTQAYRGASVKLRRLLETRLERVDSRRAGETVRSGPPG